MTNEEHNRYVAYAFFAHAGFQLFTLLMMGLFFALFFGSMPGDPEPPPFAFFGIMFAFMLVFQLVFTVPAAIAAWAMLKRKPWARTASIVGAVTSAMSVPIGTAACVYALWYWTSDNWKDVYPDGGSTRGNSPRELDRGDEGSASDEFDRSKEWTREPPDWR